MKDTIGFNTKMLHALASYGQREILPPISQVSAFSYESMEELERVFAHKSMGYAYTRIGNPTLAAFEQKINSLEGGIGAISTSSGMAAISAAILNVCESGDEIIVGRGLYGGTIDLFHDLAKLGIHTICARDINDKDELEGLIEKYKDELARQMGKIYVGTIYTDKLTEAKYQERKNGIATGHILAIAPYKTGYTYYFGTAWSKNPNWGVNTLAEWEAILSSNAAKIKKPMKVK